MTVQEGQLQPDVVTQVPSYSDMLIRRAALALALAERGFASLAKHIPQANQLACSRPQQTLFQTITSDVDSVTLVIKALVALLQSLRI